MKKLIILVVIALVIGISIGWMLTPTFYYCQSQIKLNNASVQEVDLITSRFHKIPNDSIDVDFEIIFYNNPYSFDSTSLVSLAFNDTLIYRGNFNEELKVAVPRNFLNRGIRPYLLIEKDGKLFDGWKKEPRCFTLNYLRSERSLNRLNVIFFPSKTAPGNYIMFSGWVQQ
jgi:hypothetical protein